MVLQKKKNKKLIVDLSKVYTLSVFLENEWNLYLNHTKCRITDTVKKREKKKYVKDILY